MCDEMDWDFTSEQEFGFASSFSAAPVMAFAPQISGKAFTAFNEE